MVDVFKKLQLQSNDLSLKEVVFVSTTQEDVRRWVLLEENDEIREATALDTMNEIEYNITSKDVDTEDDKE